MCEILPSISVLNLGRMCFKRALEIQKSSANKILCALKAGKEATVTGKLFLVEHNPVYTIGFRKNIYDEKIEKKLKSIGADFIKTDRGGLITFHGPGQLVVYPVIFLGSFSPRKSIKWYVNQLENSVIDMCNGLGILAETSPETGVWVADKKIAAIGIHGSRYVTTHGLAINCNVDLDWFSHIVPCGIPDKGVTSLSQELKRDVSVEEVIPRILDSFQKYFPCNYEFESQRCIKYT